MITVLECFILCKFYFKITIAVAASLRPHQPLRLTIVSQSSSLQGNHMNGRLPMITIGIQNADRLNVLNITFLDFKFGNSSNCNNLLTLTGGKSEWFAEDNVAKYCNTTAVLNSKNDIHFTTPETAVQISLSTNNVNSSDRFLLHYTGEEISLS